MGNQEKPPSRRSPKQTEARLLKLPLLLQGCQACGSLEVPRWWDPHGKNGYTNPETTLPKTNGSRAPKWWFGKQVTPGPFKNGNFWYLCELDFWGVTASLPLKMGRNPKRKGSSSNHPFSGANLLLVSGRGPSLRKYPMGMLYGSL